jgi:hypothetical protein
MATYITNLFKNTTVKYLCVKPLDKMEFWSLNFGAFTPDDFKL